MKDLASRVAKLERSGRRWRLLAVGLLCVLGGRIFLGAQQVPQSLVAHDLTIMNDAGVPVFVLDAAAQGGASAVFMTARGKEVVSIGSSAVPAGAPTGHVTLYDADSGKQVAGLSVEDQGGLVTVGHKDGKLAAAMATEDAGASLSLKGRRSKALAGIRSTDDRNEIFTVGTMGKVEWSVPIH